MKAAGKALNKAFGYMVFIALMLGGLSFFGFLAAFFMGPVIAFCDGNISKHVLNAKYKFLRHFTVIRYYDYAQFKLPNTAA